LIFRINNKRHTINQVNAVFLVILSVKYPKIQSQELNFPGGSVPDLNNALCLVENQVAILCSQPLPVESGLIVHQQSIVEYLAV